MHCAVGDQKQGHDHEGKKAMNGRNVSVDIMKGILIILVVMAHYARDTFHDVVFLFHMPLFFMLSGFLQTPIQNQKRLAEKTKRLMRPYLVYLLIDYLLIKRSFSFSGLLQMVWADATQMVCIGT